MKDRSTNRPTLEDLLGGIKDSNRVQLSRAITLIESTLPADQVIAKKLLDKILKEASNSIRIGITGVPGVGKSTFIEALGSLLTSVGRKVAVLTVDPSSSLSQGSILGDKTRMTRLAMNPKAYIRSSPAGNTLGGVAQNTRETILLCEAAGYDTIIVETVGVGQSETVVKNMVDFFLLLMIPGAGDELQGIKRGVMEMADALVINKADGQNIKPANQAKSAYENALHLFPSKPSGWSIPVLNCSSTEEIGVSEIWKTILAFFDHHQTSGWISENRKSQELHWFDELLKERLFNTFFQKPNIQTDLENIKVKITAGELSVRHAVDLAFSEK